MVICVCDRQYGPRIQNRLKDNGKWDCRSWEGKISLSYRLELLEDLIWQIK